MASIILTDSDFREISGIVRNVAGIELGDGKKNLVASRLLRRLRTLDLADYGTYCEHLRNHEDELKHLLDAISTNVTSFFREADHFDAVIADFRRRLDAGQTRFRYWSAACSSGQEPLTLAMVLDQELAGRQADIRILATDINSQVLHQARSGRYTDEDVEQIPSSYRHYFNRHDQEWQVAGTIHNRIVFKRMNLSRPPFKMSGPMAGVFCRNVLIYFSNQVRDRLIAEMSRLLHPDGLLIVGHAEGLAASLAGFAAVQPSVYRRLPEDR